MKILRFEDIIAWQQAKELTIALYDKLNCGNDFSFRDQIRRAAISVMNNIAEGFERQTNNELRNFFYMAKGSCGEIRSMLYIALDRKYLTEEVRNELYNKSESISKMLSGFIKKL